MMNILSSKIWSLIRQLLPQGRAWLVPPTTEVRITYTTEDGGEDYTTEDGSEPYEPSSGDVGYDGGIFDRFNISVGGDGSNALGTVERVINDGNNVVDALIPDNDHFTDGTVDPNDNDCDDGERRWHLYRWGVTSASTPTRLERMATIRQKMAYPGTVACRQTTTYLAQQLLAAGFAVTVLDNNFGGVPRTPAEVLGIPVMQSTYALFTYGGATYGGTYADHDITIIANNIVAERDANFDFVNYRGSFYIFGIAGYGDYASIPAIREAEFRQMVLRLKPGHLAGIGFIHFT